MDFLIDLYETDDLNTIINFLNTINNDSEINSNYKTRETIEVLNSFLKIEKTQISKYDYTVISDDRVMPSYFLINDIRQNMTGQNNLTLFLLSLISMNNKNWHELHPEHLNLILQAFNLYDQGSLIKPIILEILGDLNII